MTVVKINKLGTFGQSWHKTLNRNAMVHWISLKLCTYTAAIYWPKSKLQLGWNNTLWPFSCISKVMVQKKYKNNVGFFLCIIFYRIYCVIFSYINLTFPQTSKCFLSNGTKNIYILASAPELQAGRFGYVILGENWKKGQILIYGTVKTTLLPMQDLTIELSPVSWPSTQQGTVPQTQR